MCQAGSSYPAVITVAAIPINSKTLQSGGIIGSLGNTLPRAEVGYCRKSDDLEHLRAQARAAARHDPIRKKEGLVAPGVKKACIASYLTAAAKS